VGQIKIFLIFCRPLAAIIFIYLLSSNTTGFSPLHYIPIVVLWKLSSFPLIPFNLLKLFLSLIISIFIFITLSLSTAILPYLTGETFIVTIVFPLAYILDYIANLTFFSTKVTLIVMCVSVLSGILTFVSLEFLNSGLNEENVVLSVTLPIFLIQGYVLNTFYFLQAKKSASVKV
jgi:hypothetical protein